MNIIDISKRTVLVLAVSAVAAFAVACTPPLDTQKLQGAIKADMATHDVTLTEVTCPTGIILRQGTTFQCTAKDDQADPATFDVRVVDNHGLVDWKLEGKIMDMKVVGDQMEQTVSEHAHGEPVDVTCPSKNLLVRKGVTFTCDVKVGAKDAKVIFTCTSDEGLFDTQVQDA